MGPTGRDRREKHGAPAPPLAEALRVTRVVVRLARRRREVEAVAVSQPAARVEAGAAKVGPGPASGQAEAVGGDRAERAAGVVAGLRSRIDAKAALGTCAVEALPPVAHVLRIALVLLAQQRGWE